MSDLNGKVAVITGAAGGLGAALSRRFAREGCSLFLTDCDEGRLRTLVGEIGGNGLQVCCDPADLALVSESRRVVEKAFHTFGRIDILVNNAGVSNVKPLLELEEADWDKVLNINVKALFFALQTAAKLMSGRGASIVNIASVAGRVPRPTLLHYAASKAAVISITRSAALALANSGIRVNAIAPGMIDTNMLRNLNSAWSESGANTEAEHPSIDAIPLRRVAQPEEITDAAVFLASEKSRYITGQTLNVCGGIVMS